jgi:phosphoribosylformylglycinamidine synthase
MGEATKAGLLHSSHTPTLGGLAVAFALAAIGGALGAEIDLKAVPAEPGMNGDAVLFSESNSRFVITCASEKAEELESLFRDLPCVRVGQVTGERTLKIGQLVDLQVDAMRKAFKKTLRGI